MLDRELLDVEAEVVEAVDALVDAPALGRSRTISEPVSSVHRLRYASTMPLEMLHRVELVGDAAARLEVEQLAGDVDAGDLEVVLALAVREAALVELAGLGVDEVGGERAGVAAEERVRERHVAPEEADDVQPHEQHRERVDEAGRRVGPQRLREQRAVGEREPQVPGDEHGLQRLALVVGAVRDHGDRFDAGDLEALQRAQHLVLALGHLGRRLLDRRRRARPRCAKRTRWREMPLGSAAIVSLGHDSSGRSHGRSSSAGSAMADVIESEPLIVVQRSRRAAAAAQERRCRPGLQPDRRCVDQPVGVRRRSASC